MLLGFALSAVAGYGTYYYVQNTYVEYEYTFTNGDLDVDKIIATDYDDWSLNGDILFWDEVLDDSLEISSMGIRVDEESLKKQLAECGAEDRMQYKYHQMIANGTLPLTIGGGIGQSRLCMFLLEKAHIGEVQSSIWSDEMIETCAKNGITLL